MTPDNVRYKKLSIHSPNSVPFSALYRNRVLRLIVIVLLLVFFIAYILNQGNSKYDAADFSSDSIRIAPTRFRWSASALNSTSADKPLLTAAPVTDETLISEYDSVVANYVSKYKREPPELFRTWYDYAKSQNCPVFENYELIDSMLKPFRKAGGITKDMVDIAKNMPSTVTVKIVNKKLAFADGSTFNYFGTPVFSRVAGSLPDMEFILNLHDEPRIVWPANVERDFDVSAMQNWVRQKFDQANPKNRLDPGVIRHLCKNIPAVAKNAPHHGFFQAPSSLEIHFGLVPIFSYGSIPDCFIDLLIPSLYAVNEVKEKSGTNLPWELRSPNILWRGTSHSTYNDDGWSKSQAMRLNHRIRFAMHYYNDSAVDAGLTGVVQCLQDNNCENLKHVLRFKDAKSHDEHYKYRYLWDMDGNGISGRFIHFLKNSNSLIFKAKLFSEWLDNFIKPFEHYIPFNFDYGLPSVKVDLRKAYYKQVNTDAALVVAHKWAELNPEKAQSIAASAAAISNRVLGLNGMDCFTHRLLIEYHALLLESRGL